MRSFDAEHYVLALRLKRDKVPSFETFPCSLPALRHLHSLELHPHVTFVVGENGSGKSTLLEAIAIAAGFNAEGGTKNFRFHTRRSHSSLHEQSHGESFFALMNHRFGGQGFYVLCDPEAALSSTRQLTMLVRMGAGR